MYESNCENNDEDMIIDFKDLFFYLLKKWRGFLLAIIFGIVLGGIIFLIVNYKKENYEPTQVEVTQMDQAYRYKLLYEQQVKYNEDALFMQLDENVDYVNGELKYYIKAGENTPILGELFDITKEEAYVDELRKMVDYDGEERYLRSVVIYSYTQSDDATLAIDTLTVDVEAPSNTDTYGTVLYKVRFVNDEACREILNYIEQRVEELNTEYQRKYDSFEFQLLGKTIVDAGDAGVVEAKKEAVDAAAETMKKMTEYLENFTDLQLEYYSREYLKMEDIDSNFIVLKWLVIGIGLSCVSWGCYQVFRYFFGGMIRTSDMLNQYGLRILGRVESDEKTFRGIDSLILKWYNSTKGAACTWEYLVDAINALSLESLLLCGRMDNKKNSVLADFLRRNCNQLTVADMLHVDGTGLKKAITSEGILLIIELGEMKKRDFEAELEISKAYNFKILGVIVLD